MKEWKKTFSASLGTALLPVLALYFLLGTEVKARKGSPQLTSVLAIFQLTEGRVGTFSHDLVPDYLRTQPDPDVQQKHAHYETKGQSHCFLYLFGRTYVRMSLSPDSVSTLHSCLRQHRTG